MFKKSLLVFLIFILSFINFGFVEAEATVEVGNTTIIDSLIEASDENIIGEFTNDEDGIDMLADIFVWIKDTLTGLIVLIAVGVFLFIGVRLGLARGDPEEFKKGMMQLVYAIIGLFVVSVAWAAVVLVSGLNI